MDDGHVSLGDPVDVKFDTFPYSRYGLAHGIVRIVSPDSFSAQDESRNPTGAVALPNSASGVWYRSRITLDQINLHNTPTNFHLTPGMPVSADIRVGKQTILRYMLGKTIPLATEGMREP
jgi:membrane fusion protein, hemolysin D